MSAPLFLCNILRFLNLFPHRLSSSTVAMKLGSSTGEQRAQHRHLLRLPPFLALSAALRNCVTCLSAASNCLVLAWYSCTRSSPLRAVTHPKQPRYPDSFMQPESRAGWAFCTHVRPITHSYHYAPLFFSPSRCVGLMPPPHPPSSLFCVHDPRHQEWCAWLQLQRAFELHSSMVFCLQAWMR